MKNHDDKTYPANNIFTKHSAYDNWVHGMDSKYVYNAIFFSRTGHLNQDLFWPVTKLDRTEWKGVAI